ncbi:MAG: hypothetical protein ACKVWR_21145 [Acidimicrobiales bacterium]
MKKGRHRRFEEARALKRSVDFDPESLLEDLRSTRPEGEDEDEFDDEYEDEHDAEDDGPRRRR